MRKFLFLSTFAVLTVLCLGTLHAADKTIGKIFIKAMSAEVNGQQVPDAALEDSVKDMKAKPRLGRFVLADNESEANFLIVVLERKGDELKHISASFSVKDGGSWKPVAKLTNTDSTGWGLAARKVVGQAQKWVLANRAEK
jgi:hypothetical protein